MAIGLPKELKRIQERLERKYELTVEVLDPDHKRKWKVRRLKGILLQTGRQSKYETRGRAQECDADKMAVDEHLDRERGTAYGAIVARANYLLTDRPDIAHAVKELVRGTTTPTREDWCRLKRPARYLKGKPRMVHKINRQLGIDKPSVFTDADWASDKITRTSTNGGGASCWESTL